MSHYSVDFDWLIIGGGLHGGHLATMLHHAGVRDLAVVDPLPSPLSAWNARAEACGMVFLRSPRAHHLGRPGDDLRRYAHDRGFDGRHFLGRYRRPSRALFETHAGERLGHGVPRLRDRIRALAREGNGWRAHGDRRSWHARRVLLAPGPPPPRRPAWGRGLPHLFDSDVPENPGRGRIAVLGGGISAAQAALTYAADDGREVTLVSRHPLRAAEFDSLPCYSGPKCMRPFAATRDLRRRRRLIRRARCPGTLPPELYAGVAAAVAAGNLRLVFGEVAACDDAGLRLDDGRRLAVDALRLATGFEQALPGGDWLRPAIERERLPLAPCGFPVVDRNLQWSPGLFVAGRLAELELGPTAGNIRGAQAAGERVRAAAGG